MCIRDSSPDASRLDDRIAQYQGTSGDNSPFAHYCVVKDGGTHPYHIYSERFVEIDKRVYLILSFLKDNGRNNKSP